MKGTVELWTLSRLSLKDRKRATQGDFPINCSHNHVPKPQRQRVVMGAVPGGKDLVSVEASKRRWNLGDGRAWVGVQGKACGEKRIVKAASLPKP